MGGGEPLLGHGREEGREACEGLLVLLLWSLWNDTRDNTEWMWSTGVVLTVSPLGYM